MNLEFEYEYPKEVLNYIFVVDVSGSMWDKLGIINKAFEEVLWKLEQRMQKPQYDHEIRIAILEFSTGARWINDSDCPKRVQGFYFTLHSGGKTELGEALTELNRKLNNRYIFPRSPYNRFCYPSIIFITDGPPSDSWKEALKELNENQWYKHAAKVAFAIDDADLDCLEQVVGNREAVITIRDMGQFEKVFKYIVSKLLPLKYSEPFVCNDAEMAEYEDLDEDMLFDWDDHDKDW